MISRFQKAINILMDITPIVSIFQREITEIAFIKVCTQLINLIVKVLKAKFSKKTWVANIEEKTL